MNEENRPQLPKKLPPQDRKKLSITFPEYDQNRDSRSSNSINSNLNDPEIQEYSGPYYKEPIDQPPLKNSESEDIKPNVFFNQSIYLPLESEVEISFSDSSDIKSPPNIYLSLDKLKLEESILNDKKNESNDNKSDASSLNDSLYILEIKDDVTIPPIPPKRTKKPLSLSKLSLASSNEESKSTRISSTIDEYFNYLSPNDLKADDVESFKKEIFKHESNKTCADCKRSSVFPNWISCVYLITLCDSCAECHLKLSHLVTRFYVKKIDILFENLKSNDPKLDHLSPEIFVKIFDQAGNEKINSLLEYNSKNRINCLSTKSDIESFIKEKYLFKKFINTDEIDLSSNFVEELNKSLHQIVSGPSIPMTIYYIFLGADRNYFQNEQTLLDISIKSNQVLQYLYLSMNKSLKFNELNSLANFEFVGDVFQIFNTTSSADKNSVKKYNIYLQIKNDFLIMTQFDSKGQKSQKICLNSIIKIFTLCPLNIELKWCSSNHCILSHFLEFSSQAEQQIWLKNIITKLNPNINIKLAEIIQCLQINSFGYLTMLDQFDYEDKQSKLLIILLQSLPSQIDKFFQKLILFINIESESELNFDLIDTRKIGKIKLDHEILILEILGRTLRLKSDGLGENLKLWYEKLINFSQLEFRSIEEQLLNRENCVLLVDKCCSHVELYHMTEPNLYSIEKKNSKKYTSLMTKLEREREAKLDSKDCNPNIVAKVLKAFFYKHIRSFHSDSTYFDQNKNSVFYSTIKRVALHLNYVSHYHFLNQMSKDYLCSYFKNLIFTNKKFDIMKFLVDNCEDYFDLAEGYMQNQLTIFDRVIKLKTVQKRNLDTNAKFLVTIYLFHKNSEQSFQIQIDSNFTCKDVLLRARDEFSLFESKYWCLFEVFDPDQHFSINGIGRSNLEFQLERIIPSKAKLIESMSNWSSFNLVVKYNSIQIEMERFYVTNESNLTSLSFLDQIECLVLCELCGNFRTSFQFRQSTNTCSNSHKKWKNYYLSVRNANLKIVEFKANVEENFDFESAKIFYEEKIENCLLYYGLYAGQFAASNDLTTNSDEDISGSRLFSSMTKLFASNNAEISINEEECLTIFDKNQKLIFVINLASKESALTRYCSLFKLAYYPDTWSIFKSDQIPNMKPKVPEIKKSLANKCKK